MQARLGLLVSEQFPPCGLEVRRSLAMSASGAVQHWLGFYRSLFGGVSQSVSDGWARFARTEFFANTSEGGSRAIDLVALVICFAAVHAFWERVRRYLARKLDDAKARRSEKSR